jgi:serine phosphatase RsbU (regulator of sigma subunit)
VFVSDGVSVKRHRGQAIFVGEGRIKGRGDVKTAVIPANPNNKFYIGSDGLFDQIGGTDGKSFGYKPFESAVLEHHGKSQSEISDLIWEAFEAHRAEQPRRDDVQLITFKPVINGEGA